MARGEYANYVKANYADALKEAGGDHKKAFKVLGARWQGRKQGGKGMRGGGAVPPMMGGDMGVPPMMGGSVEKHHPHKHKGKHHGRKHGKRKAGHHAKPHGHHHHGAHAHHQEHVPAYAARGGAMLFNPLGPSNQIF
jgi:hypothetical protein